MYVTTVNEIRGHEEALKESKEGHMSSFGGKKGCGK